MLLDAQSLSAERSAPSPVPRRLKLTCASDVQPERVKWLWPGWLPFGKLVSLDGVAGIGKSTLVIDLIARATRGGPMPDSDSHFPPISVLLGGVEDGWADTVRPRLDAALADLKKVHFVETMLGQSLTIPKDVVELVDRARDIGASWLHIDAIMGVLCEDVSANSDHEVRRALGALRDAAVKAGLLVSFVRHPRKAGGLAVHAGGGSVAFTALARVGLFVGLEPTSDGGNPSDQRRVLAVGKNNLSRLPTPLAFSVEGSPNGAGCIAWLGPCAVTADELAAPPPPPARQTAPRPFVDVYAREKAWLRSQLPPGASATSDQLKAAASGAGIQWHRIKRAASADGVSQKRDGFGGSSVWYFPSPTDQEAFSPLSPAPVWCSPDVQLEQLEQLEQPFSHIETAVPTVPTVPTGRVRVTFFDGTQAELDATDRDLTEMPLLFRSVESL